MRRLITALALLLAPAPCFVRAADTPTNTLAAAEAADGWLLLYDGSSTFGWDIDGKAEPTSRGLILGDKEKPTVARTHARLAQFEATFVADVSGGLASVDVWQDEKGHATLGLSKGRQECMVRRTLGKDGSARMELLRKDGKKWVVSGQMSGGAGGAHAVGFSVAAGETVTVSDVKVKPVGTTPLFDGKTLKGWKQFPDRKSVYAVTKEGWLNVKDGPGDLQTEGQWADFVFQCQCISNGDHLNSGIFFRCIPGEYQNGYEAQIRNQWEGEDRTKPVDFGTGAIYRRQPARKVVSTDKEWFTLTILARGNRLMTWVDGYPVADWADDRPADDNPRKGTKTGKGAISIQGHDPTTDLSFRALRIAELPAAK